MRKFVKENHEDVVTQEKRQAAKERMFRIKEPYKVISHEEKRVIAIIHERRAAVRNLNSSGVESEEPKKSISKIDFSLP